MSNPGTNAAVFQKLRTKSSAAARNSVDPAICAITNTLRVLDRPLPIIVCCRITWTRSARLACSAGINAGVIPAIATSASVNQS